MQPLSILPSAHDAAIVFTCEHASCAVPIEYDNLGLDDTDLREHIGWDIGAATVTAVLSDRLGGPAVLSGVSRLVIDCNRDLADHDLILAQSDGVRVPANCALSDAERDRRIREFYAPYHVAVDATVAAYPEARVLSIHSFTPRLNGQERRFDVGVLFDAFDRDAAALGRMLARVGFRVRYNQPYSGLDGLIFSARSHGMRHARRYLELEINNALLRTEREAAAVAERVAEAVARTLEAECASS